MRATGIRKNELYLKHTVNAYSPYRGIWYTDERLDFHEILDEQVRINALSVHIICTKDNLVEIGSGNSKLKEKSFGEIYNLYKKERFFHQPVAAGLSCSGVLTAENVVVTAAHFVDKTNEMAHELVGILSGQTGKRKK